MDEEKKFELTDDHGAKLLIMKDDFGITISTSKDNQTLGTIVYLNPSDAYDLLTFLEE